LLNPVHPSAQLIGVPRPALCETLARVLQSLGVRRGMVVSGSIAAAGSLSPPSSNPAHLDELSTLGDNTIAEFYQDRGFATGILSPENFPLLPATLTDLEGGDRSANAEIVRRILHGQERGPKRDAVLLNAGAALFVAGRVKAIGDGWDLALELIEYKAAQKKLEDIVAFRP
jgi:anthranilate phosphoribosyltransferase